MDQVHVVRHKILVEGRSIRSVSRQLSISRNTIRKYLKVSEPVRVTRQKKASPVMKMIAPRSTGRQTLVAPSTHPDGDELYPRLFREGRLVLGAKCYSETCIFIQRHNM